MLIGCVVFLDALVGEKGLLETVKKRQEFRTLEQSIQRARAENEALREEAKRLRSDPDGDRGSRPPRTRAHQAGRAPLHPQGPPTQPEPLSAHEPAIRVRAYRAEPTRHR